MFAGAVVRSPDFDQAFFCGIGDGKIEPPVVPRACFPRDRVADHARLVEASKSPTSENLSVFEVADSVDYLDLGNESVFVSCKTGEVQGLPVAAVPCPEKTPAVFSVTEWRWWCDEYRIRSETRLHIEPPASQTGGRLTWFLTDRAVRKIADSCYYVSEKKGGYTTFLTLTFSQEKRDAVAQGATTFQREVSRCMDALQKIYRRDGWGERMGSESLLYCWVVENPKNDKGEDNPHVHVLMRWSVKQSEFDVWAKRIESVWGQGWANLQKIKDKTAAGAYMAKAIGYLTKAGEGNDQGLVRGNRYGISKEARAPLWAVIAETELRAMGLIIAELHDHITEKYGALYKERKALNEARSSVPKDRAWKRARLAEKLAAVRKEIKKIPVVCSKYVVTFKGRAAFEAFTDWARADDIPGFEPVRPDWLPDALPAIGQPECGRPVSMWWKHLKCLFEKRQRERRAWNDAALEALQVHRERCAEARLRYWNICESDWLQENKGGGVWVTF